MKKKANTKYWYIWWEKLHKYKTTAWQIWYVYAHILSVCNFSIFYLYNKPRAQSAPLMKTTTVVPRLDMRVVVCILHMTLHAFYSRNIKPMCNNSIYNVCACARVNSGVVFFVCAHLFIYLRKISFRFMFWDDLIFATEIYFVYNYNFVYMNKRALIATHACVICIFLVCQFKTNHHHIALDIIQEYDFSFAQ